MQGSEPRAGGTLTVINYILNIPSRSESPYPNASNTTREGTARGQDQETAHCSVPCDWRKKLPPHGRLGFISTRPPGSNRDTAGVTISHGKSSVINTKASASGTTQLGIFMGTTVSFVFPFGVVYPGSILFFLSFLDQLSLIYDSLSLENWVTPYSAVFFWGEGGPRRTGIPEGNWDKVIIWPKINYCSCTMTYGGDTKKKTIIV